MFFEGPVDVGICPFHLGVLKKMVFNLSLGRVVVCTSSNKCFLLQQCSEVPAEWPGFWLASAEVKGEVKQSGLCVLKFLTLHFTSVQRIWELLQFFSFMFKVN